MREAGFLGRGAEVVNSSFEKSLVLVESSSLHRNNRLIMLITKLAAIFVESNEKEFLVQVLESQMKNDRAFIELLCCLNS